MSVTWFFDFDGVICDSIEETYVVSRDVFFGFGPGPANEAHYSARFRAHRRLVHPGPHFLLLHLALNETPEVDDARMAGRFAELLETTPQAQLDRFEALFYALRAHYQSDRSAWLALNPLTEYGQSLRGKTLPDHVVVTTKDRDSVALILDHHGIYIPTIYDREDYKRHGSKDAVMSRHLDAHPADRAFFVDDAPFHLDSISDPRITPLFCTWGYGTSDAHQPFIPGDTP